MGVKTNVRSRGLGDTAQKLTRATGIEKLAKAVVKAVTGGEDCGCEERAERLNKLFPYKNQ